MLNGHKRRESNEIMYDILRAALSGQKKTRVMYESKLNLKQLNLYLTELASHDLITYIPDGKYYVATERGRSYARAFEHYKETVDLLHAQEGEIKQFLTARTKPVVAIRQ